MSSVAFYAMIVLIVIGLWLAGVWLFMVAWNAIAPLFNGPRLAYLHALALWVVISAIGGAFKANTARQGAQ